MKHLHIQNLLTYPHRELIELPTIEKIKLLKNQKGKGILRFHYEGSVPFHCNLECRQCRANTHAGSQCNKRSCKYLPYCAVHLRSILGLRVKRSNIRNAGLGLFTVRDIANGRVICPYSGELTNEEFIDERYGTAATDIAPYVYEDNNFGRDSACVRFVGAYANHSRQPNATFHTNRQDRTFELVSNRNIQAGSEILVNYGDNYFRPNQNNANHRTK